MSTNFTLDLIDDNSDSEEDLDYVPPAEFSEKSDDEAESSDEDTKTEGKKGRKRARQIRVRKVEKKVDEETKVEIPVVDEKQKANDLWKSFLDEVSEVKSESTSGISFEANSAVLNNDKKEENSKTPSVTSSLSTPEESSGLLVEAASATNEGCVKPCADSFSDFLSSKSAGGKEAESLKREDAPPVTAGGKRKGLDSLLNRIMNKKQKSTTLQKSLIDWKSFKKEEGIEEDLQTYNRGKGGFIERQRFLERSDLRSFEAEKEMRLSRAKKS